MSGGVRQADGTALHAAGLTRRFGALIAVDEFGITLSAGAVVGLIGPNGAGKTTALNLLNGLVAPDKGSIAIGGADMTGRPATGRAAAGLARSFQHPRLVGDLTCIENVALGAHARSRAAFADRDVLARARDALAWVGLRDEVGLHFPDRVPPADRRWVEIARIMAADPSVILLDEPTSGFTNGEVARLADRIQAMAAEGRAVLLVTHDVSLAMSVCHHIVVMNAGRVIAAGTPAEVLASDEVVRSYLGDKGRALAARTLRPSQEAARADH